MSVLKKMDPEIYEAIRNEKKREQEKLILIASENYSSQAVLEAQGCLFTNKYAEGYPGRRYYGGCEFVDIAENLAIERAKALSVPSTWTFNRTPAPRPTWRSTSPRSSRETQSSQ
jgi:glycine hydroxymethyltransferase